MTMIVPGVLNGSKGALYYSPEEIAKSVTAWNNIPITVSHPETGGSAKDVNVLERQGIGVVRRSRIVNGTLKADGWFDIEKTKNVDAWVHDCLARGKPFELSTGLYTKNTPAEPGATYKGRSYAFVASDYRPDHLAVLPNQVGACSLRDGCGVLVNSSGGRTETQAKTILVAEKPISFLSRIGKMLSFSQNDNGDLDEAEAATLKANRASRKATTRKDHARAARLHSKAAEINRGKANDLGPDLSFGYSTQADVHDAMMKQHACKAVGAALTPN
jgi:hypothetical protein